jgi:hypothetical protein
LGDRRDGTRLFRWERYWCRSCSGSVIPFSRVEAAANRYLTRSETERRRYEFRFIVWRFESTSSSKNGAIVSWAAV